MGTGVSSKEHILNKHAQQIFDQVFRHPMTHNLQWSDVKVLFSAIGTIEDERNDSLQVSMAGHSIVFQPATMKDAARGDQVMQIRQFIQAAKDREPGITGPHFVVLINHLETKIYRTEMKGTVPDVVKPEDNLGHHRHVHSAHDYSDHIEKPNHEAYFEAITKGLNDAEKILLLGSGQGSSNTMDLYTVWLRGHHPNVSEKVFATEVVDESHLTENQLLAKARIIYGG